MAPDEDNSQAPAPPPGRGIRFADVKRAWKQLAIFIGICSGGFFLAQDTPLREITQWALLVPDLAIAVVEMRSRASTAREGREQLLWVVAVLGTGVASAWLPTNMLWIALNLLLVWTYILMQFDCGDVAANTTNPVAVHLFRFASRVKRLCTRTTELAAAGTVIVLFAVGGTAFASFAAIEETPPAKTTQATEGIDAMRAAVAQIETVVATVQGYDPKVGAPGGGGSPPNETSKPPAFSCPYPRYPNAEWAVEPIQHFLRETERRLGEPVEGCVESLNTEYLADDGFVWGVGINPNASTAGNELSIVVASRDFETPGIFLSPAIKPVERLIHVFHDVGAPQGYGWPHFRAASGDYYLLDTAESGTCVLLRTKSGEPNEVLPFTTLYPSVAEAWLVITRETKSWQWVIELAASNRKGEREFKLTAAGADESDATVTFDPVSHVAKWKGTSYGYPAKQTDIDPSEISNDVNKYLK